MKYHNSTGYAHYGFRSRLHYDLVWERFGSRVRDIVGRATGLKLFECVGLGCLLHLDCLGWLF